MIDLHTHTTASDGALMPQELVAHAAAAGLRVLAITDHDTTGGIEPAAAALPAGMTLLPGVEISCRAQVAGRVREVHLLAYLFVREDRALADLLGRVRDSRELRARRTVGLLRAEGHRIEWPQVAAVAGGAPVGGRHLAAAMVAAGIVSSVDVAFGPDWLGGPFHAPMWRPEVTEALTVVRGAGGVGVLAHPCAPDGAPLSVEFVADLAARGLVGIEVDHPDHDEDARRRLRHLADELTLLPIGSSGFHGPDTSRLGSDTTTPQVYARLIAHASGSPPICG